MPLQVELVKSDVAEMPASPVSLLLVWQSFLHELPTEKVDKHHSELCSTEFFNTIPVSIGSKSLIGREL